MSIVDHEDGRAASSVDTTTTDSVLSLGGWFRRRWAECFEGRVGGRDEESVLTLRLTPSE